MTKSIQALREQRSAKAKEVRDLVEKKDWNPDVDQPVYDAGMSEIDVLDKRIENMQRAAEKFDANGELTDAKTAEFLGKYLEALRVWTLRFK